MAIDHSAIKKMKLLITVVDKEKGEFYMDVIAQFPVNLQMHLSGQGTASSEVVSLLGLNNQKSVVLSLVREDLMEELLNTLEDKFQTVKNGRGVAFAVPLSSVIGANLYRFMSDNRMQIGGPQ